MQNLFTLLPDTDALICIKQRPNNCLSRIIKLCTDMCYTKYVSAYMQVTKSLLIPSFGNERCTATGDLQSSMSQNLFPY